MVQRQIEDKFVLLQDTEQIKVNILVMTNFKNAERFRSCVTNYSKKDIAANEYFEHFI